MTEDILQSMAARRTVSDKAERMYLTARHHRQQSTRANNDQAIELYKSAIQEDPDFALAYTGLAAAYLDERYFSGRAVAEIAAEAGPLLAKAEKLQPKLPDIYVVRGALASEQSQPEAARRYLLQAIRLNSNSVPAMSELGYLYLTSGEPREALQNYTRAALLDPINGNLHAQRCLALQDLAQYDEAARACERARAFEPQSEWSFTATALLASARGRIDEALEWNRAALERSPNLTSALVQRGEWLLTLGLTDEAQTEYSKARESLQGDARQDAHILNLGFRLAFARGGARALRAEIAATPVESVAAPEIKLLLAEAALFVDDAPLARQLLDSALADKNLAPTLLGSPWSARTGDTYQLAAAMIKARTGDAAGAAAHLATLTSLLDRMAAGGVRRYGLEELRAKVAAERGNPGDAIRALRAAASLGWPGERRAQIEPYFAALRDRDDYREIIKRVAASNEAMRKRFLAAAAPRS
jgi:tetratricopeptide (TPR) repeat protein